MQSSTVSLYLTVIIITGTLIPSIAMSWVSSHGSSSSLVGGSPSNRGMDKRSDGFLDVGCYGDYDKAMFARLDRLCEECYELYRVPDLFTQCRKDCFRNDYFPKCIEALMVTNEKDKLMEMVDILNRGRQP